MQPQEILPSPELKNGSENNENTDSSKESISAMQVEKNSAPPQGSVAISGSTVDDAQGALGAAQSNDDSDEPTEERDMQLDIPESADDIDLIEKIWVQKAKDIVSQTEGDPHNQNKQLNKMKAEYIKKRYSKDIKLEKEKK